MMSEKTKYNAIVKYKKQDKDNDVIYGILSVNNEFDIWVPDSVIMSFKIGDSIPIQCALTKNPDPFRMIQVEVAKGSLGETESSIEDTKTES